MRIYLDTNILFDYLQTDRVGHTRASEFILFCIDRQIELCCSTTQVTDVYYSLRKAKDDEFARKCLSSLFTLLELVGTPPESCIQALVSRIGDYEDALQERVAKISNCEWIITNDKEFLRDSNMAITPDEMLRQLKKQ